MERGHLKEAVHTLIFSDVHLGSSICEARALHRAIEKYEAEYIIGNGDLFNRSNFELSALTSVRSRVPNAIEHPHRLPRSHLKLLQDLNGRAKRDCRVIWVHGNHDDGIWQVLSCFIGASVYEEYEWEYRGEKFLAIHGDQFDSFYHNNPIISEVATLVYEAIQRCGPRAQWICSLLKNRSKHYTRAIDFVAQGATAHAAHKGVQHVFCGHTHLAEHRFLNGVHYYNSGCWTARPSSFITIGEKGIRIHYFDNEGNELHIDGPYPLKRFPEEKSYVTSRVMSAIMHNELAPF